MSPSLYRISPAGRFAPRLESTSTSDSTSGSTTAGVEPIATSTQDSGANMNFPIDETTLHRTAKYFMDNGRAVTHEAAMRLLGQFGLTVRVGAEVARSAAHQT